MTAVLLVGRVWLTPQTSGPIPTAAVADHATTIQFVIVAHSAASVALVGDFNDWNTMATPMERVAGNGMWTITVPLAAGRYRYAFLVDGTRWLRDPSAPPMLDDEFGRPGSVLTIGEL
jgi:1,4-alpha-glucan branching enzyme